MASLARVAFGALQDPRVTPLLRRVHPWLEHAPLVASGAAPLFMPARKTIPSGPLAGLGKTILAPSFPTSVSILGSAKTSGSTIQAQNAAPVSASSTTADTVSRTRLTQALPAPPPDWKRPLAIGIAAGLGVMALGWAAKKVLG